MDAAALLRRARREAGLTQEQLAGRAGMNRCTVSQIESGTRSPSLRSFTSLLAAAGVQVRAELEPLDADVIRLLEAHRRSAGTAGATPAGADDPRAPEVERRVVAAWDQLPGLGGVSHRIEGVAAAALLGVPLDVRKVEIAVADQPETFDWLADGLTGRTTRFPVLRVRPPDWIGSLRVEPRSGPVVTADDVRAALQRECPDRWFWLEGHFEEVRVRLAAPEEVARAVRVQTSTGGLPAQPLDELTALGGQAARVIAHLLSHGGESS